MNICVTGLNKNEVKAIANALAVKLKYKWVDADAEMEPMLIKSTRYPTALVDDLLQENETKLLYHVSKLNDCVVSVSAEMFLPNNHAKLFKNSITIAVLIDNLDNTEQNLQKLIAKQCKFASNEKEEILNFVSENL